MRLNRRLVAAALTAAALPLLAACAKDPIGNTNSHISVGPPLPEVHPTVFSPAAPASTTAASSATPSASPTVTDAATPSATPSSTSATPSSTSAS